MLRDFTWMHFGWRILFAFVVVFGTYNPTGYSYFHWGIQNFFPIHPLRVVAGIILLIGWVIFLRATLRSLGGVGLILTAGLFAALLWLFIFWGWIPTSSITVITYAVIMIITLILAVGMSWSHIRRRMSGQVDTDDIDDND
jgi:Ca2+/H+ antiporter